MVAGLLALAPGTARGQAEGFLDPTALPPDQQRMGTALGEAARAQAREALEEAAARPAVPREVELFPSLPLASAAGFLLRPDPEPSGPTERAQEELDRYFDEVLQQDRMQNLGASPWYHDMARELRRGFAPDMRALEDERREGMSPIEVLVDELGRYRNGPERPQDVRGAPPPEIAESHHDAATRASLEWMEQTSLLNAPTTWYRVDLRVTQNPEGVVAAAWVLRTSGYDTLDEAALRAVRTGLLSLPPPPAGVVRDRDAIQSDWAFEAADVATYWNTAGCVDDPVHGGLQCASLGRGIVRTRIRLLRVVDAETASFEARRARRRPPTLRD